MKPRQLNSFATTIASALAICALSAACSQPSNQRGAATESADSSQTLPADAHIGVFGLDGTGVKTSDNTILHRFVKQAKADESRYYEGTNLLATNFDPIVEGALGDICTLHNARPFDAVALIGYSRGGGGVLSIAARLEKACPTPVKVRWIGLIDAVVTSIEETLVEGNTGRNFMDIRCVHMVKTFDMRPFLGTAGVLSCAQKVIRGNHSQIAQNETALTALKDDASSVLPSLFAVSGASPAGTEAGIEAGSTASDPNLALCRSKTSALACLQAQCSWSNARCDPIQGSTRR